MDVAETVDELPASPGVFDYELDVDQPEEPDFLPPLIYENQDPPGPTLDPDTEDEQQLVPYLLERTTGEYDHFTQADAFLTLEADLRWAIPLSMDWFLAKAFKQLERAYLPFVNRFCNDPDHRASLALRVMGAYYQDFGGDVEELREHEWTHVINDYRSTVTLMAQGVGTLRRFLREHSEIAEGSNSVFIVHRLGLLYAQHHPHVVPHAHNLRARRAPAVRAGCANKNKKKAIEFDMFLEDRHAAANNCFFVNLAAQLKERFKERCPALRADLFRLARVKAGLPPKCTIPMDKHIIACLCNAMVSKVFFPFLLEIYDCNRQLLVSYTHGDPTKAHVESPIRLLYHENHLRTIVHLDYVSKTCPNCGSRYKLTHGPCSAKRVQFYQQIRRDVNYVMPRKEKKLDEDLREAPIVVLDFETMTLKTRHHPYALGIMGNNGVYEEYYGLHACYHAFESIGEQPENFQGTWVAHNGGRFDYHVLLRIFDELPELYRIKNICYATGRFISVDILFVKWGISIRLWDSYNFVNFDLRKACKAFGLSTDGLDKGVFPYYFLDSEEKLEYEGEPPAPEFYTAKDRANRRVPQFPEGYVWSTKKETLTYLEKDVRSLHALVRRFEKIILEHFARENIFEYVTLAQLSYAMWTRTLEPFSIEATLDPSVQLFYRQALYGGRIILNRWKWRSAQLDDILEKKISWDQVTDYYVNMDVNGLYSAVMLEGYVYPTGLGTEVDPPRRPDAPFYIAEVTVIPNKRLAHSLLPRREGGRLLWDHTPRTATYTSVDLEYALRFGYEVTTWHRVIEFHEGSEVFAPWISKCNTLKRKGEDSNNPALKNCGKLAANCTYGKTTQHERKDETAAIYTARDLASFFATHHWKDYIKMDTFMFLIGESRDLKFQQEMRKSSARPIHLGAFVTAYARVHMYKILENIDPTLEKKDTYAYMDTDSLHLHARYLPFLEQVPGLHNNRFGAMKNDLSPDAKIIAGNWISPKCYREVYILSDGSVCDNLKAKGVPDWSISKEFFSKVEEDPHYVETVFFQTLMGSALKPQDTREEVPLAFYNGERHRTLNKTPYAGGKREIDGSFSILCNEYPDAPSDLEMDLDELDDEPASPVYLDSDVEEALCEL